MYPRCDGHWEMNRMKVRFVLLSLAIARAIASAALDNAPGAPIIRVAASTARAVQRQGDRE